MTISRRDFLKTSSMFAAWAALAACMPLKQTAPELDVTLTAAPTAVLDGEGLLLHTLRRLTFGPTPQMISKARQMGLDAFIEEQLSPAAIPDLETDSMLEHLTTLKMTPAELLQLEKKVQPVQELIGATLLRQWHSERQVYEMMVDFWSNHFSIYIGKNLCRVLKTADDLKTIRPNALGKFSDLLQASAHSPAMLIFLDQAESSGDAPNENYARELMELHTIGVSGGYTQEDVTAVARVLTGWTILGPRKRSADLGTFVFNPAMHDFGEKTVLGVAIQGTGEEEGIALLNMLASQPSAAQFISKKIARRFVSDNPDSVLVDSLAQIFTQTGGDTREMIRAVIKSDAFKNSAGQKFKRPLEFFISALRLTETTVNRNSRKLQEHLRLLGQVPFTWQPPNGFPDVAAYWSTTSGLLERWNFGLLLANGQIDGLQPDIKSLTKDAGSAQDVVDVLSIRFLGQVLPEDARSILIDFISTGNLDHDIPSAAGLILGSPYFQVR
jgi:uncharacterized protein (DUF1800 family)